MSHKDQAVLDNFLNELRSEFEQEYELTENKGLVNEYLGIIIDYSIAGKVVFTMFDNLEDMIVKAAHDLENSRPYYPGTISCSRLMMIHQYCYQRTRNHSIVMLRDYYLQARG